LRFGAVEFVDIFISCLLAKNALATDAVGHRMLRHALLQQLLKAMNAFLHIQVLVPTRHDAATCACKHVSKHIARPA
jgi:hypothetical protein